jgi:hypothetical protein
VAARRGQPRDQADQLFGQLVRGDEIGEPHVRASGPSEPMLPRRFERSPVEPRRVRPVNP